MLFNYDDCNFEAYERDGYMYYREVSQGGDPLYDFIKLEWHQFDYTAHTEDLVEILEDMESCFDEVINTHDQTEQTPYSFYH